MDIQLTGGEPFGRPTYPEGGSLDVQRASNGRPIDHGESSLDVQLTWGDPFGRPAYHEDGFWDVQLALGSAPWTSNLLSLEPMGCPRSG
jgi:hypothetical protein